MSRENELSPSDYYDYCVEQAIKNGDCPDCGERQDSPKCCTNER